MMAGGLFARTLLHMGRESVELGNGLVSAIVNREGSMTPVFGLRREGQLLNAHWIPPFRTEAGAPWVAAKGEGFWKSKLLYDIAGDFLCGPNFGPACPVDGAAIPAHGWTSNESWSLDKIGVDEEAGFAYADFGLEPSDTAMPLGWKRRELVFEGLGVLQSSTLVRNGGNKPIAINIGRHATLGPPFLEAGCRISLAADRFATPPSPSEFSGTGRLVEGAEFASLAEAPLRKGGRVDLGLVPGLIGFTDLVAGAIPAERNLGWSCVVNPRLGLAYVSYFPGRSGLPAGEIALDFNALWMQYGGRRFTPWAETEGGEDRTLCLGPENAVSAFANGLAYARKEPELLGNPTLVVVPAKGELRLHYGSALVQLDPELLREGVLDIQEGPKGALILKGRRASQSVEATADFNVARRLL